MSTLDIAPEVAEFVSAVRTHLADLDPEEQREILDGLEADLDELVTEQGAAALGDPAAYAAELRQAAGLEPAQDQSAVRRRAAGAVVTDLLDASRARFDRLVDAVPGDLGAVLAWLRPVWWVLRGWVAVQALDELTGVYQARLFPEIGDLGTLPLLLVVLASVLLGAGKVWRGNPRHPGYRLSLLVLNTAAVIGLVYAVSAVTDEVSHRYDRGYESGFAQGVNAGTENANDGRQAGLYRDGIWVSNIYPYDAQGRPLVGVQLFDQVGEPINVITQPEYEELLIDDNGNPIDENGNLIDPSQPQLPRIFYPWTNGATQLFNVFPLPSRIQSSEELSPTAFTEEERPRIGAFPQPVVPRVSLPGISTGAR